MAPGTDAESEQISEFIPQHEDPALASAHISRLYADLPRLGHYELLGLTPEASPEQIKKSFYDMALLLHPDRHFTSDDDGLKHKLQAIYKRVAECYQVLNNPTTRRDYDVELRLAEREEYEAARQREAEQEPEKEPEQDFEPDLGEMDGQLVMLDGALAPALLEALHAAAPDLHETPAPPEPVVEALPEAKRQAPAHARRTPGPEPDVVLEDTAPPSPREALPTPSSLPSGDDEDQDLPAASPPVDDPSVPAQPVRESPLTPPALDLQKGKRERYGSARLKAIKARRPAVRIVVGLLIAMVAGAVVPGIYSGWAYYAHVEPLRQQLDEAQTTSAGPAAAASSTANVQAIDRKLFEVIWTQIVITCVFWGILSVVVGTMWFRRH